MIVQVDLSIHMHTFIDMYATRTRIQHTDRVVKGYSLTELENHWRIHTPLKSLSLESTEYFSIVENIDNVENHFMNRRCKIHNKTNVGEKEVEKRTQYSKM